MRIEAERNQQGDHDTEKIYSITGLHSQPLNDTTRVATDKAGNPLGLIEMGSADMIEEDLALAERGEYFLPESIRDRAVKNAFSGVLRELGPYVPKERFNRLFPGLDGKNPETYDLRNSRLSIHIIPDEDFAEFDKAINGSIKATGMDGFTAVEAETTQYPLAGKVVSINMGTKELIVAAETDIAVPFLKLNPATAPTLEQLESNLEITLIHEIAHNFGTGEGLPTRLTEGITEWYAQMIASKEMGNGSLVEMPGRLIAYRQTTKAVALLFSTMLKNGVGLDTINRAFVSQDEKAKMTLSTFLANRYGLEDARKIFSWEYETGENALEHISDLEERFANE
ncbi:hypothetical protein KJ605_00200 [Patescibacteria group bacterium]|nr:hypothetical protein [Patescibacteria group bacterium]MBU1970191.1 hypothetical protein [Patescibacteria group bacterium]